MSIRTESILSVILSMLMLVIFAVLTIIIEMLVLNGVSESQAMQAIGISLACRGFGAILVGVLAWKTTAFLIQKFNLNPALAVLLTIAFFLLVSGMISILSIFVSIPLAGIQ